MVVSVFGLGFVGLTAALGFAAKGIQVYGIDADQSRRNCIASGQLPFYEPEMDEALKAYLGKTFMVCDDVKTAVEQSDCIFYCVGTPCREDGSVDLSFLFSAIDQTLEYVKKDRLPVLVIKSTIPPSTTRDRIIPFVESKGFLAGKDIGIATNPEFLREGHCWNDFIDADRIVLGVKDEHSERILRSLYQDFSAPVLCVSITGAEFIKYLSNTFLATMISFSNEMSVLADGIEDIDIKKAFQILHMDRRWKDGSMSSYVYPGCGYGGYCLPKDTKALKALAENRKIPVPIVEQVIATNEKMPTAAAKKIMGIAKKNEVIGILGLSFKPASDDVRYSPSAGIIKTLHENGYRHIMAYDPMAINVFKKQYTFDITYTEGLKEIVQESDLLVIATAWEEFRELKQMTEKRIVDCRYCLI